MRPWLAASAASVICVVLMVAGGCTSWEDQDKDPIQVTETPGITSPVPLPEITSHVVLDWDLARIWLPLDLYGNTTEEMNLLAAAQEVLF